jgi:hypothetical protein
MKAIIERNEFYSNFNEQTKKEFALLPMAIFCNSVFLIDLEKKVGSKVRTFDPAFVLNENQMEKCQFSWKCGNDKIETNSLFFVRS